MLITAKAGPNCYRHFLHDPVEIFLDGVEVRDVAEADDERGYVVLLNRQSDGSLAAADGKFIERRVEGLVRISGVETMPLPGLIVSGADVIDYRRPTWMNLIFAGKDAIDAASPEDRAAYYAWADHFTANPEFYGFCEEHKHPQAAIDDAVDRKIHAMNGENFE